MEALVDHAWNHYPRKLMNSLDAGPGTSRGRARC